jgi:hypothetical protein
MVSKILAQVALCLSSFYGSMLAGQASNLPNRARSSSKTVDEKRREFFALDRSQVLPQSGTDTVKDRLVDSYIASAIKHITSTDEPDYLSCRNVDVHIVAYGGSRFHPAAGVLIDRTQVRKLTNALPNAPLRLVALFVVAHECAHAWQFKRYPLSVMEHQAYGRFLEFQADLLAAMAISRPLKTPFLMMNGAVFPTRWYLEGSKTAPKQATDQNAKDVELTRWFSEGSKAETKQEASDFELIAFGGVSFSRLARSIGSREWYDTSKHPPPPYRQEAALIGLWVGLYLRFSDEARLPVSPDSQAFAETWHIEYKEYMRHSPPLPDIGETDVFQWSRKATEQLLSEEENIAEFPKP